MAKRTIISQKGGSPKMPKGTNKKTYTTSLDADLISKFKVYCVVKGLYQNEVLESLIRDLLNKESEGGEVGNSNK